MQTSALDRLELELRSIPGVVAVGLDQDGDGSRLLIQVVVIAAMATPNLRDRVRRLISTWPDGSVSLELLVDALPTAVGL